MSPAPISDVADGEDVRHVGAHLEKRPRPITTQLNTPLPSMHATALAACAWWWLRTFDFYFFESF